MSTPNALQSRGKKHIVIIDDNTDVADSLAQWLKLADYVVSIAYTGAEGLHLVSRVAPDVILLDIGLPDKNGYDIALQLNSIRASLPPFTLVAVTGYGYSADNGGMSFKQVGFDHYFAKPLGVENLRSIGLML
jgi:two-component system, sensor histidine kinase